MKGRMRITGMKRPLFWSGLSAVAVTMVALSAPLWLTLSLVAVLLVGCFLRRGVLCALLTVAFLLLSVGYRHTYIDPACHLDGQTDTITGVVVEAPRQGKMYTIGQEAELNKQLLAVKQRLAKLEQTYKALELAQRRHSGSTVSCVAVGGCRGADTTGTAGAG